MTEQQEQELREQYASASDDELRNVLNNSSAYAQNVIDIVGEVWSSRPEGQKVRADYERESDAKLLKMLKERPRYAPGTIAAVSAILKSRGDKLSDDIPRDRTTTTRSDAIPAQDNGGKGIYKQLGNIPKNRVTTQSHGDTASYPLTTLCAKWYGLMFEIVLWLLLIGGIIHGFKAGKEIGILFIGDEGGAFIGAIIGVIVAILVTLFAGGLISVFLKLCADVVDIKRKLRN